MATESRFELQPAVPEINRETCQKCGRCAEVCGGEPLIFSDGEVQMNPEPMIGCLACGHCMMVCPTGSISVIGRDISREDLLEIPSSEKRATPDQLEALLLSRRSIREYRPEEVEQKLVDEIIKITSTAPMGIPPSEVGIIIFHGRNKVRMFTKDMMDSMGRLKKWFNPVLMTLARPFMKKANYDMYKNFLIPFAREMIEMHEQGEDSLHYDAPVAMLFYYAPPYADLADCDIAVTYAMIAAESMGLGSCMIGMDAPFLQYDKKLMRKFGIPEGNLPGLALILGYPVVSFKHAIRRRFSSVKYFGE